MWSQLFRRKPIADLVPEGTEGEGQMKRTLGAWDLIFLAIGAVIGAGIFGAIGTDAAGGMRSGVMVRALRERRKRHGVVVERAGPFGPITARRTTAEERSAAGGAPDVGDAPIDESLESFA